MNKQKFVEILRNPEVISTTDFSELEVLAKENPYFQSGHIVIARASRILKSPQSAKKINTAAIYATNRNSLKNYMQGQGTVSTSAQVAKPIATPKKASTPTPIRKTNKQGNILSKAPKRLEKIESDKLIEDVYSNLEGWKKSRNQFLEFEKLSDELEISTKKEKLDDAVEKIKNQIEEEVIAEDKILNDQIEKIGTTHSIEEENTTDKNDAKEDLKKDEIKEASKSNLNTENKPVIEKNQDNDEKEESSEEENIKENATIEEPSPEENFSASDYLKSLRENKEIDTNEVEDTQAEDKEAETNNEPAIESDANIEEPQGEAISTIESTQKPEEEPNITNKELETPKEDDLVESKDTTADEEATVKNDADSKEATLAEKDIKNPEEELDTAKSNEPESDTPSSFDIADNELTSKLIDEEIEEAIQEVEGSVKTQESSDEIVVESESETTNISTEDDVNQSENIKDEDIDTKASPLKEEALNLLPKAGKSNKKFRLSVLNRRKGNTPLSKKKPKPKKETSSTESKLEKTLISKKKEVKEKVELKEKEEVKVEISEKNKRETKPSNKKIADQANLIDSFLKANPTIKIDKADDKAEPELVDFSKSNSEFPKEAITENLAKILVSQDKVESAIKLYTELMVLQPEKAAFYQTQIDELNAKAEKTQPDPKRKEDLLAKFIEENPTIIVFKWDDLTEIALELATNISSLPKDKATESLAEVLSHEKLFKQSISIYERLSLIYPEKIAYFASQIEKLKNK